MAFRRAAMVFSKHPSSAGLFPLPLCWRYQYPILAVGGLILLVNEIQQQIGVSATAPALLYLLHPYSRSWSRCCQPFFSRNRVTQ